METAEKITLAREQAGLSKEAFAAKLDVSMSTVQRLEAGWARLTLDLLKAIADVTGRKAAWFL